MLELPDRLVVWVFEDVPHVTDFLGVVYEKILALSHRHLCSDLDKVGSNGEKGK